MPQIIENSSWESIVGVSTFDEALFESYECFSFLGDPRGRGSVGVERRRPAHNKHFLAEVKTLRA